MQGSVRLKARRIKQRDLMVHKIALREKHIEAGTRMSRSACPVALAIREALGSRFDTVDVLRSNDSGTVDIRIDEKLCITWPRFKVEAFVFQFDHEWPVSPLTIGIEFKTVVHDKGWRRRVVNGNESVIFGNIGVTRCGQGIDKAAISYSTFVTFHDVQASFVEKMKLRWRLFVVNQVFAGAPRPDWAEYCDKCFRQEGYS